MNNKESYTEPCPSCGSQTYLTRSGPHIKWSCEKCGYIKFLPQNETAFIMPFGKYKGYSLQEIKDIDIIHYIIFFSLQKRLRVGS